MKTRCVWIFLSKLGGAVAHGVCTPSDHIADIKLGTVEGPRFR